MSTRLLLWNGGSGKADSISELMQRLVDTRAIEITDHIDIRKVIAEAVDNGCDRVIAAGGDGTVNAVVNAMMRIDQMKRPALAIVPLGTANDFAGTLEIPDDIERAIAIAFDGESRLIDVVQMTAPNFERYYANVAAGGNCTRVSEELTDEIKQKWGALCYIRGAVGVLSDMQTFRVIADCDDERIEVDTWAVLVANGKTNAGRIPVAPQASPNDGLIDVIIIRDGGVIDMVEIVTKTLLSNVLESDQVIFRQVKKITLSSIPDMRFTVDGEVVDEYPTRFEVVPKAIRMMVGPSNSPSLSEAEKIDDVRIQPIQPPQRTH